MPDVDQPLHRAAAAAGPGVRRRWSTRAWRALSLAVVLGLALLVVGEGTGTTAGWVAPPTPSVPDRGHHHGTLPPDDGLLGSLLAQVATEGLEPALDRLRTLAAGDPAVLRAAHYHAHELASAAQARFGTVEAFARCDAAFHSGCYHGVIEAHIGELPALDRTTLTALCEGGVIDPVSAFEEGQCLHGMGHGLLSRLPLRPALEQCDALSTGRFLSATDTRESCYGGAFMARADTPPAPVELCTGLDARYLTTCYFYQGPATFRSNGRDIAAAFATCERATPLYATYCYEGLGRVAGSVTTYDPEQTQQQCRHAALPYQPYCIRGAAQFLVGMLGTTDQAIRLCEQAPVGSRTGCFEFVGRSTTRLHDDPAQRAGECAKSPPAWIPACREGAGLAIPFDGNP